MWLCDADCWSINISIIILWLWLCDTWWYFELGLFINIHRKKFQWHIFYAFSWFGMIWICVEGGVAVVNILVIKNTPFDILCRVVCACTFASNCFQKKTKIWKWTQNILQTPPPPHTHTPPPPPPIHTYMNNRVMKKVLHLSVVVHL